MELFDCTTIDLREKDKGELVTRLQTLLKQLGYYVKYNGRNLVVDGYFGPYTAWAVRNFQGDTGHSRDAWVGSKTCKSLNEKIQALNATNSSSSSSSSTTSSSVSSSVAKHKIQNVYTAEEGNIHIEGVHLIATSVTPTTHFKNGNWKYLELTNDDFYPYKGHSQQREYSVECYLSHEQFRHIEYDLELLSDKPCRVVSDTMITPGYYNVSSLLGFY